MVKLAGLALKAKIAIAAAAAAVVSATVGVVVFVNSQGEDSYRVVKVFETQGEHNTVERKDVGVLDAYSGMNLQNGDIASTGADSNMHISLDGNKYILLDHDSKLELIAENNATDSKTIVQLKEGEILNEITEPLSNNSTYEVNTPKATMAVRGTSFDVRTTELENGSYITDLEVIHGKVAVWLYDEEGNKKCDEVTVSEGYMVTIVIDPNENTNNAPDVDGNAYFVFRTNDGIVKCENTDSPPYKTDFTGISESIRKTALTSDNSGLLVLDDDIARKLRGEEHTVTFKSSDPDIAMPDNITLIYGTELSENLPELPTKPGYTGTWTVNGETIPENYIVESDITVTAVYTINKYTVTFETTTDGVTMPENLTLDYGTNLFDNLPAIPEKTGYTGKWTIDGEEISADYVVEDNVTVTAVYTVNRYTVTFETDETGVTMPEKLTLDYGTNLLGKLPAVPDKTGYTGKWTIGGEEISADYIVEDNVIVTAVYTINKYTVTFESEEVGVTMPESLTLDYGTTLLGKLPAVPDKTGYTGKWTIDGEEISADYTIEENVTVTAVYTINRYTVTFETDETGVTMPENLTLDYGTTLLDKLPDVPEKKGYTGKWTIEGEEISADYVVEDDITVTAVYTINRYTVTFETDETDVTMPENLTLDYGTTLLDKLPDVPEKKGYTGKWTIGGEEISADYVVEDNVTVTAVYTINKYTVTFESEETDVTMPENLTLDYGTNLLGKLPDVPEKTGYTGKWTINGSEISADYVVEYDITVTAVYTINKYTVTFESEEVGVTMPESLTINYGTNLLDKLPDVPEKTGYTGKWTIDGEEISADYVVEDDITVTAVYTINKYTATFETDETGVTMPENLTLDYGTNLHDKLPNVPEKTGYTGKWTINGKEISDDYVVEDNVTVTAVYTINHYTVTFESEETDVTMPENLTLDYGTNLFDNLPAIPEKTGYTGKWTIGGEEISADYVVEENITVTAVYTINHYTVTFTTSETGVTMPENLTLDYGTNLFDNLPAIPEKTGYTGKWTIDGKEISADYVVEENITVTAVYTINRYTVTFENTTDGVTMPEDLTLDYGTNLFENLPTVPEKKGYTGKWTINGEEISADYLVENDVTVTAVYTINKYTVTFETDETGVTMPEDLTLDYGTNLLGKLPAVPDKTGYTGKWTIDGKEISADYVVEDNVTVTAVYTMNKYTVTFETTTDGVTMPENLTLDYGTNLFENLPTVPEKTGYTGKWTIDGEEISSDYVVENDVIVTAVYTINRYTLTFETAEDGVTMPENLTLDYGTNLLGKLPDVPEKTGYTGKWTIDGNEISADYVVEDNVTVTAVYTINHYTVTFESEETDVTMPENLTLDYGTNLFDNLPAIPEKTGYTGKWTIDGEEISADYVVEDNVTITAVYTINKYTVTFETSETGVTMPENFTLDYGTNLFDNLPAIPEKTNYTGKWTIDGEEISAEYVVEDNVTVTAVYTINHYTVTFESEETNVTMPESLTLDYGTNLIGKLPDVPEKKGYTGKWTIGGEEISSDYTIEENVIVTAVYTINRYTVTFETDETDVTMPESLTINYGTNLHDKLPNVPEKTGYTGKWTIDGEEISADYVIEENITVTAVYTINCYTVTFETATEGVTMPESLTLDYGTNLLGKLPAVPDKTGYTGKWTIGGKEISAEYIIEDDVTVTAVYTINRYTVTFETSEAGVTMPEDLTLEYGANLLENLQNVEVPQKAFNTGKWTIDGAEVPADKTVDDDITITAVYTHIKVNVSFEYVGGYSDNEDVDLQNFVLKNLAELSFDHDISAEEFYKSISEYLSQVTDYTVAKTVYLKPSEMPQNILDIFTLPEFTASTLLSDCAEDIVIDGEEVSQLTICFLPEWTVHTVTFNGIDSTESFKILNGMSFASLGMEMPKTTNGSVWIYWTANQAYYEFYEQTDITDDTAVYSGYAVSSYGYSNGVWQTDNLNMIYKKAGDTLTDADLSALVEDGFIAGFISSPVTDSSEISGFVEAGTVINANTDLYAVKGKFDYTDANGEAGTVYWLGDSFSLNMLPNVEEVGYKWHFDNEAGEEFNEETFWAKYDELLNNNSPYNAARFTIVAVKAYDHTVTYQSSDGSETVYYFNEGETLSENSRYTYDEFPSGRLIYDTEGAEEGAYPQYDFLGWDIEISSDYVIYEGIELAIKVRTLTSYDESKIIMKAGDVIPKETIEAMEANAGRKFIAYNMAWNYATSEAPQGEMNELYLLSDPIQGNSNGMMEIYLLTHVFQYTTPNGDTVYLAVDTFISDKFMENVVGHDYGLTGTWYYKKEEEWIEVTDDLTISSVFPDPCLVEVKLEPNV